MRLIIFIILLMPVFTTRAQNTDNAVYMCKYTFSSQKDSTNKSSVVKDIMCLNIGKENSTYYSYLKQLGLKNAEEDIAARKPLEEMMKNHGNYFAGSESEIMIHYYSTKKRKVLIRFKHVYCYTEAVESLNWKIHPETITILQQTCQKATAFYKGRNYTAWFATSIPYRLGPWEFTGLPGLILRVSDANEQFVFECTELLKQANSGIYKEYADCVEAPKKKVEELKRLLASDRQAFDQIEWGTTLTTQNPDGTTSPVKLKIQPYNPIDLSHKY